MRLLQLAICCSMGLFWSATAFAQAVVLLRPPTSSSSTTELLERLRGELLSVGFEVAVSDRPMEMEPTAADSDRLQQLAATQKVDAVIDLVGEPAPVAVDVWITDGSHHFQRVARVAPAAHTDNALKGVAIRASEVLRASLFEKDMGTRAAPAPATATPLASNAPVTRAGTEPSPRTPHLGFELGAAMLTSLDGIGPAVLPVVRFNWAIEPKFVLQASLAGGGTRPNVTTEAGNAEVAIQYGLLGAAYRIDWEQRLRPFGALSLGALRTAVAGQAEAPREGHSVAQWSALFEASLGVVLQLSRHYDVVLAGHAQLAQPYVAIHFGEQKVASAGRPNLLLSLTLGVWP